MLIVYNGKFKTRFKILAAKAFSVTTSSCTREYMCIHMYIRSYVCLCIFV